MPASEQQLQAFAGHELIATGQTASVAAQLKALPDSDLPGPVLVFVKETGQQIDLDLSGSESDISERYGQRDSEPAPEQQAAPPRRGRPRLGVVGREVTLLPRHWQWLDQQRGGASAALRRLIEASRQASSAEDRIRQAQDASNRFMTAIAGNLSGFEEAMRALYARQRQDFERHTARWPADVRRAAQAYADPVWTE